MRRVGTRPPSVRRLDGHVPRRGLRSGVARRRGARRRAPRRCRRRGPVARGNAGPVRPHDVPAGRRDLLPPFRGSLRLCRRGRLQARRPRARPGRSRPRRVRAARRRACRLIAPRESRGMAQVAACDGIHSHGGAPFRRGQASAGRAGVRFSRDTAPVLKGLAGAAAGAAVGAAAWGWFEAGWVRLEKRELHLPRLPSELDGLRIAHLSDFHLGVPSRGIVATRRAVEWTAERSADLVCVTGDLLSRPRAEQQLLDLLARLGDPYVVLGNHDYALSRDPFSKPVGLLRLEHGTLLADHMHAGQIVLPYAFGKLYLAHLRARYIEGVYERGGTVMHVSRGLGTTFVPFRFFARPEATELVLRSGGSARPGGCKAAPARRPRSR